MVLCHGQACNLSVSTTESVVRTLIIIFSRFLCPHSTTMKVVTGAVSTNIRLFLGRLFSRGRPQGQIVRCCTLPGRASPPTHRRPALMETIQLPGPDTRINRTFRGGGQSEARRVIGTRTCALSFAPLLSLHGHLQIRSRDILQHSTILY